MPKYTTSYKPPKRHRPTSSRPMALPNQGSRSNLPRLNHSGRNNIRGPRLSQKNERKPYAIIAIVCSALVFLATIIWYNNRGVDITLNGYETSVHINSTIPQLIESEGLQLAAGNMIDVDDVLLERGVGEAYHCQINGKHVTVEDCAEYKIVGGEEITLANGEDIYEEHEVESTEIQPTVTMEGSGAVQYVSQWGIPGRSEKWTGKVSGKTVERGVVQEVVNAVITCSSVVPSDGGKYIALTFDEAPSSHTEEILAILTEKDVHATFFAIGQDASESKKTLKAIIDQGSEIGTCGQSNETMTEMDQKTLRSDLEKGLQANKAATDTTAYLRSPYGGSGFGLREWSYSMDLIAANVLWNVDSGDWLLPGSDAIVQNVLGSVTNGDIVELSDNDETAEQLLEALPQIIDALKADGYKIVTVSELLKTDSKFPDWVTSGQVGMPKDAVLPHANVAVDR